MNFNNGYPNQRVSEKDKRKNDMQWAKDTIDQLVLNSYPTHSVGYNSVSSQNTLNEWEEMYSNYQLYNNILNQKDFERECNPFGLDLAELKDEIKPYNKAPNKIQVLLGEELKRPFDYRAVVTDTESVRTKFMEQDLALEEFSTSVFSNIMAIIESVVTPAAQESQEITEEQQKQMDEQVDKLLNKMFSDHQLKNLQENNFLDTKEDLATSILEYLGLKLNLPMLKNEDFKHGLISGKELVWVGVEQGEPVVKVINPLSFFGHKSRNTLSYEDGLYAGSSTLMSAGEILTNLGDMMTDEQIKNVEDKSGYSNSGGTVGKTMKYPTNSMVSQVFQRSHRYNNDVGQYGGNEDFFGNEWEVHHVEWKSMRKVYFKYYVNDYGDEAMDLLSEDFAIPDYAIRKKVKTKYGNIKTCYYYDDIKLEESWIEDVWEGYKVGDMYVGVGRKEYQFRSLDNPYKTKLGYHGVVYSNTNAAPISIMGRMKPFLYLYFIVAHRLKTFIAQDRAPLIDIDITMIDPKIGLEKTLYYMDQLNINFYNPVHNAELAGAHQRSGTSRGADRSTMQHINNYISLLAALDQEIADVAGVSKNREGASDPYETATASQQSIIQSSHVTEIYFEVHAKLWERVLNSLVQVAQECWKDKSFIKQYVLDDLSVKTLEVTPDGLMNSDIGIFISNSRKDNEIFNKMEGLVEYAINSQSSTIPEIIRMYKAGSTKQIEDLFQDSQDRAQMQAQQAQEAEQNMLKQQAEAEQQKMLQEHENEKEITQMKIDADIRLKEMDVFKFQQDLDVNNNQVPDHLEIEKLKMEKAYKTRELDLKDKEIESKERIEKTKARNSNQSSSN